MKYVRCINNRKYFYFPEESRRPNDTILGLEIGQVYKLAPPDPNDQPDELRVIDGTGEDYVYPASYFEPFVPSDQSAEGVTVYLDPYVKGILYAEAIAAHKPVSALLREWIDERLDLPPATVHQTT